MMIFKSTVFLFLFYVSVIEGTGNDAPSCGETSFGYEFANQTGQCYKFHALAEDWTTANSTCLAEGAHLVIINSDAEAQVLVELFKLYPPEAIHIELTNANLRRYIAIGIYYESETFTWKTIDGQTPEQAGFDKWIRTRPQDDRYDPYGFMNREGKLNNGSNKYKHAFICEKKSLPLGG